MEIRDDVLRGMVWRRSSFSGGGGHGGADCVELAVLADGRFAVRDSKNPGGGVVFFASAELGALIDTTPA
jgi:hypothetical protein